MRVLVINGPNLDLLGTREPETYGTNTLADLEAMVSKWASGMGVEVISSQSNHEGEIIELIHEFDGGGIVLNPGAFTHTSHAIADAIRGVDTPVVETHISNLREREPWRAVSLMASACARTIYEEGSPATGMPCVTSSIAWPCHSTPCDTVRTPTTSPICDRAEAAFS
jgi:3-dehydroquinate dehydratase-2